MSPLINDTKNEFENDKNFLDQELSLYRQKPELFSNGH